MKSRFSLKINNLSFHLLISYLSILIFPFLAILIIYLVSSSYLLSVQKERIVTNLRRTALKVDRGLIEAGNMEGYIASQKELLSLGKKTQREKATFFDVFMFKQTLPDYSSMNSMIDGVYLFFHSGKWMIKNYSVVPADERAYLSVGKISEENYEKMAKRLSEKYYSKNVMYGESENDGKSRMMILQSFPYKQNGETYGTIAITLNDKLIKKELASNLIGKDGQAFIVDRDGFIRIGVSEQGADFIGESLEIEPLLQEEADEIMMNGKTYIIAKTGDTINKDTYIVLLPKKVVLGQIGNIKYLIILLSVASVIMGLGACLLLWRKRRRTVLAFSEYWEEFGVSEIELNSKNIFWEGLPKVLNRVADLQASLRLQKNFIKTAVIRRLLLGDYQAEGDVEKEIGEFPKELIAKRYYAAVLSVKGDFNRELETWNELRLIIGDYIKENLRIGLHSCEIDYDTTGFILPVKDGMALEKIRNLFTEFQDRLKEEKHLETYISLGTSVDKLTDVSSSFDEAMETMEYLKFHDIRMVMTKGEIPEHKDSFFFPIETELLLVKSIKMVNKKEVEDIFRVLEYENYTFRSLSGKMRGHLLELVRATVIRTVKEEKGGEESIERLQSCLTLSDIKKEIEEIFGFLAKKLEEKNSEENLERKKEISSLISERISEPNFNLTLLAEQLSVSENKLYKEFKDTFGMSFSEYLENERIQKACELLKENIQVKEIAKLTGYGSDISFRRAFKRVMGLPPSYYAKGLTESRD